MADRPIIFAAPMVRALLEGRKTQTRRTIKSRGKPPQFCGGRYDDKNDLEAWGWEDFDRGEWVTLDRWQSYNFVPYRSGDRIWVKERHWITDDGDSVPVAGNELASEGERIRPSIHMPKWASRLTLVVTDVRVQRVQTISRGDAMAEGCPFANMADGPDPREWFGDLWNTIHGPGAWDENPWVAALTFNVHHCNIGDMMAAMGGGMGGGNA